MIRVFFLLMLLAGVALGVGIPWFNNNFSGQELGIWRVYDRAGGFKPVDVTLSAVDSPVQIIVDLTAIGSPTMSNDLTVLTLVVSADGRTVLTDTLDFVGVSPRENAPQSPDRIFRSFAGPLAEAADATYRFAFGPGDMDDIQMRQVDMILRGGAAIVDQRLQPIGFVLMAIGVIGFVLSMRRRRGGDGSIPPQPRWGRDAGKE